MRLHKCCDEPGFVRGELVGDVVDFFTPGLIADDVYGKATNSAGVCRAAVLASITPVLVLKAAYKDNVPSR